VPHGFGPCRENYRTYYEFGKGTNFKLPCGTEVSDDLFWIWCFFIPYNHEASYQVVQSLLIIFFCIVIMCGPILRLVESTLLVILLCKTINVFCENHAGFFLGVMFSIDPTPLFVSSIERIHNMIEGMIAWF
jgi:hypothetical protein